MRRPFLISALFGLGIIVISLVMLISGPSRTGQLPDGYFTPVVAFEFSTTPQAIMTIFADVDGNVSEPMINSMTNNTFLDFLFLIVYGGFLFSFALTCIRISGNRLYYFSAGLAVLAPLFDILENVQLLAIMKALTAGDPANMTPALGLLGVFTWLKWGALALYFVMLGPFLSSRGRYGRLVAIFSVLPVILGIVALMTAPGLGKEIFALSITVMFLLLIIFSFTYRTDMV